MFQCQFFLFGVLVSLHLEVNIRSVSHNATTTTFYSLDLPVVLSSCLLDSRVDGECNRVAISVITNSSFFLSFVFYCAYLVESTIAFKNVSNVNFVKV